ncbi:sigmaY antisigma factor component [Peribacillus asahii]|uniref:sigmaY antisigma factor component n=1 Tax=Peribacillus asahii TaxID=228899 RepID=UPI002079BB5E|nr:sigmaY antisigma factor component [Peribacillus asahii]USK60613.1 sigmaY antisigma factor component [Peribacillus asahii]
MSKVDLYILPIVALLLLIQSVYLFTDARKNGMNYWFWGIIGLIQTPMPLIFYLLVKRSRKKEEDELNDYRDY